MAWLVVVPNVTDINLGLFPWEYLLYWFEILLLPLSLAVDFPVNCGDQILACNVPDTEDDASYGKILFCNMPDTEDSVSYGNEDEEDMATIEELPSGFGMTLNQRGLSYSFLLWFTYLYLSLKTSHWSYM